MIEKTKVYIAAPYSKWSDVLELAGHIETKGFRPLCTWATLAKKNKGSESSGESAIQEAIRTNDRECSEARIMVALAYFDLGGEMFSEIGLHLNRARPVVWIGERRTLSAYRRKVTIVANMNEAVVALSAIRAQFDIRDEDV